ncbi:hypothetical protein BRADI_2g53640v3 [Brachypodium distachyon]|uniref:RING-type domain-containing protein n=1 Tax=Brachypodium distachyon TaxID=15368 RepID=A0A0Q3IXI1_BRADI|nr:hypothetical protein BRADI_2g53640v3 [Brachypodium distachyon]
MEQLCTIGIILGVVALVAVILFAIGCVVCCRAKAGGDPAKEEDAAVVGRREGLLNKEAAVDVPAAGQINKREEERPCAICKGPLAAAGAGPCRRLRACGHVYHAECVDLWLQRKTICPLCRASVVVSRTDIVDAVV